MEASGSLISALAIGDQLNLQHLSLAQRLAE
jgi:hypothetical protein